MKTIAMCHIGYDYLIHAQSTHSDESFQLLASVASEITNHQLLHVLGREVVLSMTIRSEFAHWIQLCETGNPSDLGSPVLAEYDPDSKSGVC